MRCSNCDTELPEGGRFCIECGQPATQAATGATERLPEHAGGPRCSACGTANPPGAIFCVHCGHTLADRPTADPPARPPAVTPAPAPPVATAAALPAQTSTRRGGRGPLAWDGVSGGLFLIGLAIIAWLHWWWPGILVLCGITALLSSAARGRQWAGLQGALWLFGLAVIAQFGWWWPGILVLVGLSALMASAWRPSRRGW
jgi:hypothetical protein